MSVDDSLNAPAGPPSPQPSADSQLTREPDEHAAGEQIGPYRLLQKIGEGGMGEVWMAEQREPIRRTVALKVIKVGMETRQVVARFEAERQALALMDHPGIAKVLDAGSTARGRAYFVMEYVRGEPLTTYCDRQRLSTGERLRLFARICDAVQHAHQKGIIHRDLKPSNVLITIQDGQPAPKIIDFGIAKATAQQLTEQTVFTELGVLIGTPEYMSPEQAEMTALDIDTRTDVYSLGVVLYELLTGVLPFDAKTLRKAGLDGVRRHIREVEPPKPSTKISSEREAATTAAHNRHTDPARLVSQLKGDLDWITMKCLEKDRTRRYASASELAADIKRHLSDQPVDAHAPSKVYRLRKLIHRNRPVFAAGAVVFVALAAGLVVSLWALGRANREAARSRQVAQFLQDMLGGIRPAVALGRDTTLLRDIMDKTAARLDKELRDQPDVEADLRNTIGNVYVDLGQYAKGETMFRRAVALRRTLFGNEHVATAKSVNDLGNALVKENKFADAESNLREALALRKKLLGAEHRDVASTMNTLAATLAQEGKYKDAEALFRDALAMQKKLLGSEHPDLARTMNNLALVLRYEGKRREAEAMYRERLALQQKLFGPEHPEVAYALTALANMMDGPERAPEAEAMQRRALAMKKKFLGPEHPDVAASMMDLASALTDQYKYAEAESLMREALAMKRKFLGHDHLDIALSLSNLGAVIWRAGRLPDAAPLYREALDMRRRLLGDDAPQVMYSFSDYAAVLRAQGRRTEAEAMYRDALRMGRRLLGDEHEDVLGAMGGLVLTLVEEGKFAEAEPLVREYGRLVEKQAPSAWEAFAARALLGRTLVGQKRYAEAEPVLLASYDGMKARQVPAGERESLEQAIQNLAKIYDATGRPDEAAKRRKELAALTR